MGIIYEIGYFHELHKGKTSHYVAHFKEVTGYEKLDEGFVEKSFRVIGTVIVESGKNKMKYTFHNSVISGILIWNSEKTFRRQKNAAVLQIRKNENTAQNDPVFSPQGIFPCNPRFIEKGVSSDSHENAGF